MGLWEPFDPSGLQAPASQSIQPCWPLRVQRSSPQRPRVLCKSRTPAAGAWRSVSIQCLDHIVREGGLRGERPVPAGPAHPSASSGSSHKPPCPLLSRFRASGSRWSLPGSRRSCIRPHSPPRTHTPWKRPSRRPWRWPAGCTRRGLLLLLLLGLLLGGHLQVLNIRVINKCHLQRAVSLASPWLRVLVLYTAVIHVIVSFTERSLSLTLLGCNVLSQFIS